MRLFTKILVGVAIGLATLFVTHQAYANSLGVEPLFLEVRPGQTAAIRVNNISDNEAPVEVYVKERLVDANGVQTRVDAEDAFIIFPPQTVIPPNTTQVFRLQPIDPSLEESKSYYVSIRQLPVDLGQREGEGARVQVVFAFDAAVHVIPRKAEPKPVPVSAKLSQMTISVPTGQYQNDKSGKPTEIVEEKLVPAAELTLRNEGSRYLYLQDQDYNLKAKNADGSAVDLPEWTVEDVLKSTSVVLVQPNSTRTFKLPLPEDASLSDLSFTVKSRR